MNNVIDLVGSLNMRLLVFLGVVISSGNLIKCQLRSQNEGLNNNLQNSCEIGQNNFNRSCIYHKIAYLIQKLPYLSNVSPFHVSTY